MENFWFLRTSIWFVGMFVVPNWELSSSAFRKRLTRFHVWSKRLNYLNQFQDSETRKKLCQNKNYISNRIFISRNREFIKPSVFCNRLYHFIKTAQNLTSRTDSVHIIRIKNCGETILIFRLLESLDELLILSISPLSEYPLSASIWQK